MVGKLPGGGRALIPKNAFEWAGTIVPTFRRFDVQTFRRSWARHFSYPCAPRLPWSPEEQDVAVRIANLEAAQTVVCILKRRAECCAMIGKFGGERIGVWCIDKGVPPHGGMTLGVRQWQHVFVGFDEELCSVAADDGEKRIPIRLLESRLKTKLIAVEGNGLIDVADDEER